MPNANDFISGLQEVIDFYRANPDLPAPAQLLLNVYLVSKEQLQAFAKAGGKVSKNAFGDTFYIRRIFPSGVRLDFNAQRDEVCERIVTGTKVIPATEAQFIPAEPEHEEEIVEWKCSPILAEVEE